MKLTIVALLVPLALAATPRSSQAQTSELPVALTSLYPARSKTVDEAVVAALDALSSGSMPDSALAPLEALPRAGCWQYGMVGAQEVCTRKYGAYWTRPPLRGDAYQRLTRALLDAPAAELGRAAALLAARRWERDLGRSSDLALAYARLGDAVSVRRVVDRLGGAPAWRTLMTGWLLDDLDLAAQGAEARLPTLIPARRRAFTAGVLQLMQRARERGRDDVVVRAAKIIVADAELLPVPAVDALRALQPRDPAEAARLTDALLVASAEPASWRSAASGLVAVDGLRLQGRPEEARTLVTRWRSATAAEVDPPPTTPPCSPFGPTGYAYHEHPPTPVCLRPYVDAMQRVLEGLPPAG